jgi:hypothetical protein
VPAGIDPPKTIQKGGLFRRSKAKKANNRNNLETIAKISGENDRLADPADYLWIVGIKKIGGWGSPIRRLYLLLN